MKLGDALNTGIDVSELMEHQRTSRHPSLEGLMKHLSFYGDEGVMESASHLSEGDQATLEKACKAWSKAHSRKRGR